MTATSKAGSSPLEQRTFAPWVIGLSAVLCLSLLPSASYAAALPLIQKEWSLTSAEAGFIFSAYQIGYVGATLLLLPLTDRIGVRWVLLASAALSVVGNALFPLWAADFQTGSLLRLVAGATSVGVYVPGMRFVADRFPPERRGGPMGLYVASFYLGSNLSVLLTGLLLPNLGWRGAYLVAVGLAALAPIVAWLALHGRGPTPGPRGSGHLDPTVLNSKPLLLAIGAYATHTWELYVARGWMAPFLTAVLISQGLGPTAAASTGASVAGIAFAFGALSVFAAGFISDRFGRTRTAAFFLLGSACCSLALGWLDSWPVWGLFLIALLYGLLIGGDSPIYSTAVTELSLLGKLGSTMAVQSFVGFFMSILGPIVFGALLDFAGPKLGWTLGFGQAGFVALLGVSFLFGLRRHPASACLANGRR